MYAMHLHFFFSDLDIWSFLPYLALMQVLMVGVFFLVSTSFQPFFEKYSRRWVEICLICIVSYSLVCCIILRFYPKDASQQDEGNDNDTQTQRGNNSQRHYIRKQSSVWSKVIFAMIMISAGLFALFRCFCAIGEVACNCGHSVTQGMIIFSSFLLIVFIVAQAVIVIEIVPRRDVTRSKSTSTLFGSLVIGNLLIWLFATFSQARLSFKNDTSFDDCKTSSQSNSSQTNISIVDDGFYNFLNNVGLPVLSEYAILCMGIIAAVWFQFDFIANSNIRRKYTAENNGSSACDIHENLERERNADINRITPFMKKVICFVIGSVIFFGQVMIAYMDSKLDDSTAAYIITISNIVQHTFILGVSLAGCKIVCNLKNTHELKVSSASVSKLSSAGIIVLTVSCLGIVLYTTLELGASISLGIHDSNKFLKISLFHVLEHSINLFTIYAMTFLLLVLDSVDIHSVKRKSLIKNKLSYLTIFNLSNWLIDTILEAKYSIFTDVDSNFFSENVSHMMIVLLSPFAILFRFHVALRFTEIAEEMWYENNIDNSSPSYSL